ncbi:MAG: hypothetical protein SGPRY_005431 [Prymnesium sp.]
MSRKLSALAAALITLPEMSAFPMGGRPRSLSRNSRRPPPRDPAWRSPSESFRDDRDSEFRAERGGSEAFREARVSSNDGYRDRREYAGRVGGAAWEQPRVWQPPYARRARTRSPGRGFTEREEPQYDRQYDRRPAPEWRVEASALGAEFVYGVSPVLAALRQQRRTVHKLMIQDSMDMSKRKDQRAIAEIEQLASAAGVPVEWAEKHKLNMMSDNRPHQGLVMVCSPLDFEPLRQMPTPEEASLSTGGVAPLWLALDEVGDPQNLGALLRSAHFLGACGVLVSEKNSAPLSPVVSKASAGAMELMEVHCSRNLPKTLEDACGLGWHVVGAALEQSIEPHEVDKSLPTILVLGSEGKGLRTNVLRACDSLVRVPRTLEPVGGAEADTVDSLNVSVAGGILLYALLAQRPLLGQ